jgi:predicted GNAT family N-acyltransferase
MNTPNPGRGSDYLWQVLAPPAESQDNLPVPGATGEFLAELSEFRGRMLYADGRRPQFMRKAGQYADNDPLDLESFHVTVRTDGALIGCIRVTPLPEYPRSFIGGQVGPSSLERAAGMMTLARADCMEAGRWIVAPSARGDDLGRTLLLSLWVVGKWLDKRCVFGAVGVRDGQSSLVGRCGGQVAPGIDPVYLEKYDDELCVMYFDLKHPPPQVARELRRVRRIFNLPEHFHRTGAGVQPGGVAPGASI